MSCDQFYPRAERRDGRNAMTVRHVECGGEAEKWRWRWRCRYSTGRGMPPCADFVPWFRVQCGVLQQLYCMRASLEEQEVGCVALRVIYLQTLYYLGISYMPYLGRH